jgi:hypothetical protein
LKSVFIRTAGIACSELELIRRSTAPNSTHEAIIRYPRDIAIDLNHRICH